jgi:undecaprenyl diphosphate synthase
MPLDISAAFPAHVGIIMDGNGRWAKRRGLPRTEGHRQGLEAAKRIVRAARNSGIPFLSLFVFSTENWRRASEETGFLMGLLEEHLSRELDFYRELKVRVVHSGDRAGLPAGVCREIDRVMADTADNSGIVVNLAINYGGRDEILRAVDKALRSRPVGTAAALTEDDIDRAMDRPDIPPPDLIIRTSGELRLSNFLLWESAYAELYFDGKLWPDWDAEDLAKALASYEERKRLFGGKR